MLFNFTDNALAIGFLTKSHLDKLHQDRDISENQMKTFYKAARRFFELSFWYAIDNLPHQDELLFNAHCINWKMMQNDDISDGLQYFIERLKKRWANFLMVLICVYSYTDNLVLLLSKCANSFLRQRH